jgi:hypothetical protein
VYQTECPKTLCGNDILRTTVLSQFQSVKSCTKELKCQMVEGLEAGKQHGNIPQFKITFVVKMESY